MFSVYCIFFFFFKQKPAYDLRISDWSSDVCSSDLHADLEDFGGAGQLRIFAVVEQIGAVAPQPRHDRLAAFGMHPDLARQAEQPQRIIEIEILGRDVLGDRRALRLLALAELDIGAEAPAALRHLAPAVGVRAKRLGPTVGAILRPARLRELAGIFAVGIITASDERPEAPTAHREPSGSAIGAGR